MCERFAILQEPNFSKNNANAYLIIFCRKLIAICLRTKEYSEQKAVRP